MMESFNGFPIIVSDQMVDIKQTKFSRCKKKRMIKKFLSNNANFSYKPKEKAFLMGGKYVMHPAMFERLKRELANENKRRVHISTHT
jgi:hypothetical protein